MAKPHSIPPFPADIDRDAFGHWLAGFVDGEGCFQAGVYSGHRQHEACRVWFQITLRADDEPALRLIQSFLGCGRIFKRPARVDRKAGGLTCEARSFNVGKLDDLEKVIIYVFEKHPLRAKKRRDFVLWKECVLLCCQVAGRPFRGARGRRCGGHLPKWSAAEREHFAKLSAALRRQREMASVAQLPLPPAPPKKAAAYLPLFWDEP